MCTGAQSNAEELIYDLEGEYSFLFDHVIQSQALFPAMGHVYTIWRRLGTGLDVHLDDFQIFRAVSIDGLKSIVFSVVYEEKTGLIEIFHAGELVSSATALITPFPTTAVSRTDELSARCAAAVSGEDAVEGRDIYSTFKRYDYNYGEQFQVIDKQSLSGHVSSFKSDGANGLSLHWISYLDGMLQSSINSQVKSLRLPTRVDSIQLKAIFTSSSFSSVESDEGGADAVEGEQSTASSGLIPSVFPSFVSVTGSGDCKSIASAVAVIQRLTTTPAPPVSRDGSSVIHSVEFVPYGVNTIDDPAVASYRDNFTKFCHIELEKMLIPSVLAVYPHLQNLQRYIRQYPDTSVEFSDMPVINVTRDVYKDPQFLENPLLVMSQHQDYRGLYLKDTLFSSSAQSLKTCVDIILENMLHKFTFLEVGTGTAGALRRIYPLLRRSVKAVGHDRENTCFVQ